MNRVVFAVAGILTFSAIQTSNCGRADDYGWGWTIGDCGCCYSPVQTSNCGVPDICGCGLSNGECGCSCSTTRTPARCGADASGAESPSAADDDSGAEPMTADEMQRFKELSKSYSADRKQNLMEALKGMNKADRAGIFEKMKKAERGAMLSGDAQRHAGRHTTASGTSWVTSINPAGREYELR
jgi:hypothetical protein